MSIWPLEFQVNKYKLLLNKFNNNVYIGGVTSTLILHPLDLIKIRFAGNYPVFCVLTLKLSALQTLRAAVVKLCSGIEISITDYRVTLNNRNYHQQTF